MRHSAGCGRFAVLDLDFVGLRYGSKPRNPYRICPTSYSGEMGSPESMTVQ